MKMHKSIAYQELEKMINEDDEIRHHKLEIRKIKKDQQKELEKYLKQEIGNEFFNLEF